MIQIKIKTKNNQLVTTSRNVAKVFGKEHKHVLRAIRSLECSEEFTQSNFGQATFTMCGVKYPMYNITKDGFAFLVMGFTGKKSAEFKEKYINAFNEMQKRLEQPKPQMPKKQAVQRIVHNPTQQINHALQNNRENVETITQIKYLLGKINSRQQDIVDRLLPYSNK